MTKTLKKKYNILVGTLILVAICMGAYLAHLYMKDEGTLPILIAILGFIVGVARSAYFVHKEKTGTP
jgi:hypothetical protein